MGGTDGSDSNGLSGAAIADALARAQRAKQAGNEARKRRLDELYTETVDEYRLLAQRVDGLHDVCGA